MPWPSLTPLLRSTASTFSAPTGWVFCQLLGSPLTWVTISAARLSGGRLSPRGNATTSAAATLTPKAKSRGRRCLATAGRRLRRNGVTFERTAGGRVAGRPAAEAAGVADGGAADADVAEAGRVDADVADADVADAGRVDGDVAEAGAIGTDAAALD